MITSAQLFTRASKAIPGGVNSPVRACLGVQAEPLFIASAQGATITDVEGRSYTDYVMSWGPMLLGHQHPAVNEAVSLALAKGSSFGAPCPDEVALAEAVIEAAPGIEMVRMVNSGTEATMSALRLARAVTGRDKVIKFTGNYHGHADAFLAAAGSGVATLSIPGTPGVPEAVVADTLLAPYNDLAAVERLFADNAGGVAALIVEPMAGNMGCVPAKVGFLEGLRRLCDANGALLIFDEVITGFRLSYGGAQARFGVTPDLTTLGKIIGGGLPVGAYGGKKQYMERIAPCGDVYQAGTLSGNPLAMAAGRATLGALREADYAGLEARTKALAEGLGAVLRDKGLPVTVNTLASMFTVFFTEGPVDDFASAQLADGALYAAFYRHMRERGVYLAPSGFECAMLSFAHTDEDMAATLEAARAFSV